MALPDTVNWRPKSVFGRWLEGAAGFAQRLLDGWRQPTYWSMAGNSQLDWLTAGASQLDGLTAGASQLHWMTAGASQLDWLTVGANQLDWLTVTAGASQLEGVDGWRQPAGSG